MSEKQKIKLFCIPYVGSSAMIYSRWSKYLSNSIELYPVELAGRGRRFKDPFYNNIEEAVDDVFNMIKAESLDSEYAVFGHCTSALLAYEVCKKFNNLKEKLPIHIFFSARRPPYIKMKDKKLQDMSEKEIIEEMFTLDTTKQVFLHQERLSQFLPVWKADLNMYDNYCCADTSYDFATDITILAGKDDPIVNYSDSYSDLKEWENYTSGKCSIYEVTGDHLFIIEQREEVVKLINSILG